MNTKTASNSVVGLKELRANMETYIKRVEKGESLTVTRRSTPLFIISPVDDEGKWETVIDFVKETGKGMPMDELLASLKKF
jgi:prevent-host-death family protein